MHFVQFSCVQGLSFLQFYLLLCLNYQANAFKRPPAPMCWYLWFPLVMSTKGICLHYFRVQDHMYPSLQPSVPSLYLLAFDLLHQYQGFLFCHFSLLLSHSPALQFWSFNPMNATFFALRNFVYIYRMHYQLGSNLIRWLQL